MSVRFMALGGLRELDDVCATGGFCGRNGCDGDDWLVTGEDCGGEGEVGNGGEAFAGEVAPWGEFAGFAKAIGTAATDVDMAVEPRAEGGAELRQMAVEFLQAVAAAYCRGPDLCEVCWLRFHWLQFPFFRPVGASGFGLLLASVRLECLIDEGRFRPVRPGRPSVF